MKLAMIGYGKMGRAIEEVAVQRGHEMVLKIDHHNPEDLSPERLRTAEVAIEFTQPEAAFGNLAHCFRAGVPVVCGTTGWLDRMDEARKLCAEMDGGFFYASNYSIGVNIFFEINRVLARIMDGQVKYAARVEEIHHVHKLDAPSGTAITLANDLMHAVKRITGQHNIDKRKAEDPDPLKPGELPVVSYRIREVPGTHRVLYEGPDDELLIMHHARSRRGFAEGAVLAAEWMKGKKGVFGMKDLLNISC